MTEELEAIGTVEAEPRSILRPRPIEVDLDGGQPVELIDSEGRHQVTQVQLQLGERTEGPDDGWWRDPVSRRGYLLVLEDGSLRLIYHDLIDDTWYEQAYSGGSR
ncbi:MAG TPA: hypothetical protein VKU87_03775 [Thermomicrobiaceae bacterium]|nr:hypothetical protein [Thermomicrobiaceae bacterium]